MGDFTRMYRVGDTLNLKELMLICRDFGVGLGVSDLTLVGPIMKGYNKMVMGSKGI